MKEDKITVITLLRASKKKLMTKFAQLRQGKKARGRNEYQLSSANNEIELRTRAVKITSTVTSI